MSDLSNPGEHPPVADSAQRGCLNGIPDLDFGNVEQLGIVVFYWVKRARSFLLSSKKIEQDRQRQSGALTDHGLHCQG